MSTTGIVTLALGLTLLVRPVPAQEPTAEGTARWLQRYTLGAVDASAGLADVEWGRDCVLMVTPRSRDQPSRRYAISSVTGMTRHADADDLAVITFDRAEPLRRVAIRTVPSDRDQVIATMKQYARLCGAGMAPASF